MTETWYRLQSASRPPRELLDPTTWQSSAWEPLYRPCGTCAGTGEVNITDDDDPFAVETCGDCRGKAEVEDVRAGVSVCATLDALTDYFAGRDCDYGPEYVDQLVVVELAGELSEDDDHDTEHGAWLIYPTRVVSVQSVPPALRAAITTTEVA